MLWIHWFELRNLNFAGWNSLILNRTENLDNMRWVIKTQPNFQLHIKKLFIFFHEKCLKYEITHQYAGGLYKIQSLVNLTSILRLKWMDRQKVDNTTHEFHEHWSHGNVLFVFCKTAKIFTNKVVLDTLFLLM